MVMEVLAANGYAGGGAFDVCNLFVGVPMLKFTCQTRRRMFVVFFFVAAITLNIPGSVISGI